MMIKCASKRAALCIAIFAQSEPPISSAGVYIGDTLMYRTPFFLELEKLVNPHISIIGMTGSGKTFLTKSIIMRLYFAEKIDMVIIDWNSEYAKMVESLGGEVIRLCNDDERAHPEKLFGGVKSIDLSAIGSDAGKVNAAQGIINRILSCMAGFRATNKVKRLLVIDEAWKLLRTGNQIERLFREGRKFGFGVLVATQLVGDIDNGVLSNAATSFIFRLQGSDNLSGLVSSGIIDQGHVDMVTNLNRGSCIVSLDRKLGDAVSRFVIGRISGLPINSYVIRGDDLVMRIPEHKLVKIVESAEIGNDGRIKLLRFFEENEKGVGVRSLVRFLERLGLDRRDVIFLCRQFEIPDASTALALESKEVIEIEE